MTCRDALDFLADYLAGELPGVQQEAFDVHLSICLSCRIYLETYRTTIALERSAFEPQLKVPESLINAILSAQAAIRTGAS